MALSESTTFIILKVFAILGFFLLAFLSGGFPFLLRRLGSAQKCAKFSDFIGEILRYSKALAGGVLLGGGLMHLVPEAAETIGESLESFGAKEPWRHLPFAQFMASATFLLILACENIVGAVVRDRVEAANETTADESGKSELPDASASLAEEGAQKDTAVVLQTDFRIGHDWSDEAVSRLSSHSHGHHHEHHEHDHHHHEDEEIFEPYSPGCRHDCDAEHAHTLGHSHTHLDGVLGDSTRTTCEHVVTAIFLWLSLSLHSLFVGLGLGATNDRSSYWLLTVGVLVHKVIESYALGLELEGVIERKKCCLTVILLVAFSLATPIGIAVGMFAGLILTAHQAVFGFVTSIFLAMSAGSFLHVSLFEFLFEFVHEERGCKKKRKNSWIYFTLFFVLFFIGFVVMFFLSLAESHDHEHE